MKEFRKRKFISSNGIVWFLMLFPLFYFGYMGAVLHSILVYDPSIIVFSSLLLLSSLVLLLAPPKLAQGKLDAAQALWGTLLQMFFLFLLWQKPKILYAKDDDLICAVKGLLFAGLALTMAQLFLSFRFKENRERANRILLILNLGVIFTLLLAHALVFFVSPHPNIDVFVNNTTASQFFLNGLNPYSQQYPDIYGGAYKYQAGFLYFPGTLIWQTPFFLIFGDIRVGFLFAQLMILGSLFQSSRLAGRSISVSLGFASLWLAFPVSLFVLEQAWSDTALIALFYLSVWMLMKNKWTSMGSALGILISIKQYAIFFPILSVAWLWRNRGYKTAVRVSIPALAVAALIFTPFLFSNASSLLFMTVVSHQEAAMRIDAYNLTAYLAREWDWRSQFLQNAMIGIGVLVGVGIIWLRKAKTEIDFSSLPIGLLFAYGLTFLFGKWAFCNYYYLLASLILLAIVLKIPSESSARA